MSGVLPAPYVRLLACPACGGALTELAGAAALGCAGCPARYAIRDGIAELRGDEAAITATVRRFYTAAPFPGYPPRDSLAALSCSF